MPKEFCKSHLNSIKQLVIGNQAKYSLSKQSYYFDKTNKILYSSDFEGILIYNISKSLIMMLSSNFNFEKEYRFMLNNNFELMANSRNFEDEYYLNQRIFQAYNINFLDILKIKPEKLNQKFDNEYKKIKFQKLLRQIKTQEYFIPHFYVPSGVKIYGSMNINNFNNSKNYIFSKIIDSQDKEENTDEFTNNHHKYNDEQENLINKEKNKMSLNNIFIDPREVIFHKIYNVNIKKGIFIENLAKELIKIPDNDLIMENDKKNHNLVIAAKNLVSKLLTKNELSNHVLKILIKFSFYYDKPFYFITIYDEKKLYLKISKIIHFENSNKTVLLNQKSSINNNNIIPYNKNNRKSRNKGSINEKISQKYKSKEKQNNLYKKEKSISLKNNFKNEKENNEAYKILIKINKYKKEINKVKFISIIKWILSIIIISILIIFIIITYMQSIILKKIELVFLNYYYSLFTKNLLLGVHSILLYTYYDVYLLNGNPDITTDYRILYTLTDILKGRYHNFTKYFLEYNLAAGNDHNIIHKKVNFSKIRGYWNIDQYESKYSSELDYVIYNILSFTPDELNKIECKNDIKNFLFFKERSKTKEKINCRFIKILYYLSYNYIYTYQDLYKEIEESIYNSYKLYNDKQNIIQISFEIMALLLYIIFFITVIVYLYFSNNIIIKDIIFLFLDFSEDNYDKMKSNNNKIINLKLIEFQKIINDFDLNLFEKYSNNLENLNKNKIFFINNKNTFSTNDNVEDDDLSNFNPNNKENLKQKSLKETLSRNSTRNNKDKLLGEIKKRVTNNSSHNYLMESNSQFFKDKLNSNSINASNEVSSINNNININNSTDNISKQNIAKNNLLKNENHESQNSIQDMILNKSNKSIVLMIKIYLIIILILFIIVITFFSFKFKYVFNFNTIFNRYFKDISVLTDRYMQVYYYLNVLRTLIIFPKEKKIKFEEIMENITVFYENENIKFNEIVFKYLKNYPETNKLINILKENKNNSTNLLKDAICKETLPCLLYLDSSFNIFDSGVEFSFKTAITQINNIYVDYKNLVNNNDIDEIKLKILSKNYQFINLMISLNLFYVYLEERIFLCFENDEINFKNKYFNIISFLNILSIIFSITIFLFVIIFIFISIANFTEPIKEEVFRINYSFYYIKKYSLINYRKYNNVT